MSYNDFLIVGLGASAGGIAACREFFTHVPADTGLAYVVILHLLPAHESQLAEVLQTAAAIPVIQVRERTAVQPDHVYVIPPNQTLSIRDGHLLLTVMTHSEQRRSPVDTFFRTLAEAQGPHAACVMLSGTGANGSLGLKHVKAQGGICLVQDPDQAAYADMPRHAIATGLADAILPVADIPGTLLAYSKRLNLVDAADTPIAESEADERALREIFVRLRSRTGHDFSGYKRPTVLRRIGRRMALHALQDVPAYAAVLRDRPEEVQALFKDLLISVTQFFRDSAAFDALERIVIPTLFERKSADDQVRVWVPACATGEEAYSVAMLLSEHIARVPGSASLQLFATDIDERAIAIARDGLYHERRRRRLARTTRAVFRHGG